MAGRPCYCRCYSDFDTRWILNEKSYVRCKTCGGAPRHYDAARATSLARNPGVTALPKNKIIPIVPPEVTEALDAKKEALTEVAAVLTKKKAKDTAEAKKTRKVGKATVNSKLPAKAGGVVTGQVGQGYIFADEPDKIYVAGDGWFGSWPLTEVSYREPGENPERVVVTAANANIVINDINDWNGGGMVLVAPVRLMKSVMAREGVDIICPHVPAYRNETVEVYGMTPDNAYLTGVWHASTLPDGKDFTWAIVPPMWNIL